MVSLEVESWTWYAVVMLVATSRYVSRRLVLGSFRKFQADDYLMIVVLCFYTTVIATINIVRNSNSNLLPPGFHVDTLTKQDISEREYGSKLILVVESCQCTTIWGIKGCLLLLYMRLTTMRKENIAVKALAAYVVLSFIIMEVLYFGVWCRPFHEYWAVPTDSPQCDAATNHLILNAVFNLSSDIAMLAIGLPMFLRMNMPWKKKIPVIGVFSLGIFTIIAAILNKLYSFKDPFGSEWTYWYTRESSTALLVANLPFVWTLWRRLFGVEKTVVEPTHNGTMVSPRFNASRADSKDRSTALDWSSKGGDDLEMMENASRAGSKTGRRLTLAEILGEDENPASTSGEEPTPYTHPLFYSKKGKDHSIGPYDAQFQRAVLRDSTEQQPYRRGSSLDDICNTPVSTIHDTELNSKKSAGSFV